MSPARPDTASPNTTPEQAPFRIRATWTEDARGPMFLRWLPASEGADRADGPGKARNA